MMLFFTALLILPKEGIAPFFISQCYNPPVVLTPVGAVVAPFFISQCYNIVARLVAVARVVAPFFISQCYNPVTLSPTTR